MTDPSPPQPSEASASSPRPFVMLVANHWLSLLGVCLALAAFLCWLFLLPLQMRGHAENPSALETNRLVPATQTCEQCHWRDKPGFVRLRVISKFAEDEANTESQTVLTMLVGGAATGGIHGSHMGPGIEIRYATSDAKRQVIPWVEYKNSGKGESRSYLASKAKAEEVAGLPKHTMQCVDCHNRPTHAFDAPERAVDKALARGRMSSSLPYIKKKSVEVLKASYATSEEAARRIPAAIDDYYKEAHPDVYRERRADIEGAGSTVALLYGRNVFPDLKVAWGTYPDNIGHEAFPGCFRCHDEDHATAEGKTITQDCGACHEAVAMDEASPQILKALGLADRLAALQKK